MDNRITSGMFYSGNHYKEPWVGFKNENFFSAFGAGAALPCCSISFSKSFKRAFRDNFSGLSSWPSSKDGEPAMAARSSAVGTGKPLGCWPTDLAFLAGDDGTFVGLGATCGF